MAATIAMLKKKTSSRQSERPHIKAAVIVCILSLLIVFILPLFQAGRGSFDFFDRKLSDYLSAHGKKIPPREDIVFLGLDDPTLKADTFSDEEIAASPALKRIKAGFPWSREVYAAAIERLVNAGAKVVALDIIIDRPSTSDPEGDIKLAGALFDHEEHVILAANLSNQSQIATVNNWILGFPESSILPNPQPNGPVGVVSFFPDPTDGVIRHAYYLFDFDELSGYTTDPSSSMGVWPSLSAQMARIATGKDPRTLPSGGKNLRLRWIDHTLGSKPEQRTIARPYPIHSLYGIFVDSIWEANFQNGEFFKDKMVLIGPASLGLHDYHPTPVGTMLGPQIHLCALTSALAGDEGFVGEPSLAGKWMTFIAFVVLAMLIYFIVRNFLWRFITIIIIVIAGLTASWLAYNEFNTMLLTASSLAAFLLISGVGLGADTIATLIEKRRIHRTLSRYVSKDIVEEILRSPEAYYASLGGVRKPVAILFSDLRGFTSMTEERDPAELVAQLNEYLGAMVRCVFENNGTVDKFIGDAMLAVWGNIRDITPEEAARSAFNCARQMRRELDRLNAKWQREKRPTFKQGIGVHYGDAIIGNLGSPEKMEFAMIGDAVNSASRIEGLTKQFGSELIISDDLANLLEKDDKPMLKPLPYVQVKGRSQSLTLYDVVRSGNISLWESYKDEYLIALKSFTDGEFEDAVYYFDRCRSASPSDGAVATVLEGARAFVRDPPKKWRGVIIMDAK